MAYKPIKDQIVAVLQGVSSVASVSGKEEKKLTNFPAACVSAKEHSSEYHTIGSGGANKEIYQHFVRLYFRVDETNDPDYEDILESVADDVIAALRHNITLNGSCDYSLPVSGVWMEGEKETPVRVFEIVEQATLHVTR
jgi:hypothetical protein